MASPPHPTVTLDTLSKAIRDPTTNTYSKKVQEGLLNDYMDLLYGKETPYTNGQQILPKETTIEDVQKAISDETTEKNFKEIFEVIATTYERGDTKPVTPFNGTWDPKFKPILVLVTPNH